MEGLKFYGDFRIVKFSYKEPCKDDSRSYRFLTGIVPADIVKKGKEAIMEYATQEIEKGKGGWKKNHDIEDNIRKNHIEIKTTYKDGIELEGRIIEATNRYIKVELDKPVKGEGHIDFGFGAAMAGHFVFTKDYKISEAGYDAAYRALRRAYERVLSKPVKDLVEKLNKEN